MSRTTPVRKRCRADWASDSFGPNYRYRQVAPVSDPATWTAEVPFAGTYQVYAWWSAWSDRATSARYIVNHLDGTAVVPRDQTENGGRWNLVGTFRFEKGATTVHLSPDFSGGSVIIADAIRFVALDAQPLSVHSLVTAISGQGTLTLTPDQAAYTEDDEVHIEATAAEGFEFIAWSGTLTSTVNPLVLTMDQDVELLATFRRTYSAWELMQFTAGERETPGLTLPENDPFGFGIKNLALYAFGLNAHAPDRSALPRIERNDSGYAFVFRQLKQAADLTYTVEVSPDLSNWLPLKDGEIEVVLESGDTTETMRVTVSPESQVASRFVRLNIERGSE